VWVRSRSVRPTTLAVVLAVGLAVAACGGDDDHVTSERIDQVRVAAREAGLGNDVADLLALAAEGTTGTFQVTYQGTGGAQLVVSQAPPNRRVDVLTAGLIVESQVVRDGVAYRCSLPDGGRPGDELRCTRTDGAVQAPGAFSDEALTSFTDDLLGTVDDLDLRVEPRTIAEVAATCLVAGPEAGTPLDGTGPGVDTICLSPEGAQLLVDAGGERVVAESYSTEVPAGTFDV
jgi:hypothetical protein